MSIDRRTALKVLAGAGAAVAATPACASASRQPRTAPDDAVGMLYDATLCVGCKACMSACQAANGLEDEAGARWDTPVDLTGNAKTVIKLFDDGSRQSFMKAQCMHCIDPACVSACMLGALDKREFGIVTWEGDKCVGCRYCQIACPYGVPRFEWDSATPKIVKCEMCTHLVREGKEPACVEACPRDAIIFGNYRELLAEAKQRVAAAPERYQQKVFGETDGGGTQVLYLAGAGIGFEDLGLPALGTRSVAHLPESVQHFVYRGFAAPVALYGALAGIMWRHRRVTEPQEDV